MIDFLKDAGAVLLVVLAGAPIWLSLLALMGPEGHWEPDPEIERMADEAERERKP